MKSVKVALLAGLMSLAGFAEAENEAMPYCFHLDGDLNNEGTAEVSAYKLTKTGSGVDSFSTTAQYGGKSLQGGASNSYILTAATPGEALVSNAHGWTLSMWVNFNGGGYAWRDVAGFSIGNKFYQIQRTNNNTYNIYGGSGTLSKELPGKTTSDWVNIVFVMAAGLDTSVKIYADGGEVGTYSATDSLAGTGSAGLTSVSIGNQVLSGINNGIFSYYGRAQSGLIDEVAVYNFAANDEQIGYLAANAPSEEMFGPIIQPDKTAYYKSGYIGPESNLVLTETSGGANLEYNRTYGNWTLIIDENSPSAAQAWCADTVKYNGRLMKIVKVVIKRDFTLKPGVTAALFDGVEFEVTNNAKLTLTKDAAREMSVGSVSFSGNGTVDLSGVKTIAEPIKTSTGMTINLPSNYKGSLVITDPENLNPEDYPEFIITKDAEGNTVLKRKTILYANAGQTVDIKDSVSNNQVLLVYGNGGKITSTENIWADKNAITSLILQHDSTIGGEYAFGLSATSQGATTADLAGYTLTIDKTGNFNLCNATISDGGTIDVVKGKLLTWGTASTMSAGTLKLSSAATAELNANLTVHDLVNGGANISGASVLTVNGTFSGRGTIPKLTMGDDATIKLSGADQLTVSSAFVCGTSLTIDLSDYLALDSAPIVLPSGMSEADKSAILTKLTVIPPSIRTNATLAVKDNTLTLTYEPMTLYWAAWRGTFWEHIGQTDVNGNHGLMRDEAGNLNIAHRPNDTVVFDKTHYTVGGEYLTTQYWHYDENLYIKNEVIPGDTNDWDLKVLGGVTLKMGLRGARTTGQNVISKLKIYVEAGSTLELGYWGNTHHYQGVIREDVTFGGAGTIKLGDDMGSSCRVEGDLKVKQQDPDAQTTVVPTLDVRGKELVVQGGQIDVNLTGFGALSGSGTITTPITFNNATIDATDAKGFTFKNETTFTGTLTVDMTEAPTGEDLIKICTKGEGGSFSFTENIDVIVRVGGEVQPAFYTLATDNDGNLCVKVAPVTITYDADVVLGYDYKTMICRVTMTPAIEGVVAKVTVKNVGDNLKTWTAPVIGMRGSGRCEVLVGDADDNFSPGEYSMTVSIGTWETELEFTLEKEKDGNLAEVNGVGYTSMQEAVAAAGETGTIKLLTNVFFAASEGTYSIARNGFDIMPVNYTTIDPSTNKVTAEDEILFEYGETAAIKRVVVDGSWVASALPWMTRREIDAAMWRCKDNNNDRYRTPWQSYVMGISAATWETEEIIARGVETGDKDTIEVSDGLRTKPAAETGVVVTKTLVDAETKREVSATPIYDLLKMETKAKLLKLNYEFSADFGQEPDQGE